MPLPTPTWTSNDGAAGIPQTSGSTNDSQPIWAGHTEPGATVHFEVDGEEFTTTADENGAFDFVYPRGLDNGDHEISTWVSKAGEESDRIGGEYAVDADSVARQNDYLKVQNWREQGAAAHRERYRPTTGGGGTGSQTATTAGPGTTTTPVGGGSGYEKGSSVQGVEKGNKEPCEICGEERGDETPCPHCGME